jgi:hypothetical protein
MNMDSWEPLVGGEIRKLREKQRSARLPVAIGSSWVFEKARAKQ